MTVRERRRQRIKLLAVDIVTLEEVEQFAFFELASLVIVQREIKRTDRDKIVKFHLRFDPSYLVVLIGRRKLFFDLLRRGGVDLEVSVFICDQIVSQLCDSFCKTEHDILILVIKILFSFCFGIQLRTLILEFIEKIVVAF